MSHERQGIAELPIADRGAGPYGVTTGPDGALWYTGNRDHRIGRVTTDGVATSFATPTPGSGPFGITVGPDGAVWVALETGAAARLAP
ncbi:virginiamycin B lyase family protein [Dactylosporangium sp. CA-139066]|uniref:virginiamycin B lyase family protein n=1 Tax=Dactylosporangium sp. CA-139066 TaxID=3239930 RepID=UPI003D935DA8